MAIRELIACMPAHRTLSCCPHAFLVSPCVPASPCLQVDKATTKVEDFKSTLTSKVDDLKAKASTVE